MKRINQMAGVVAAMWLLTACGGGTSLTNEITNNLVNSGWSYDVSSVNNVLSSQWFGDGWANRDNSPDGGTNWCRLKFNWSIENALDPYTFTIVYVVADSDPGCSQPVGSEQRFRFHMDPAADGWATSGTWLPGEPDDAAFANAKPATLCSTDVNSYAADCNVPNGAPVAP